jgi:hypothetical protein
MSLVLRGLGGYAESKYEIDRIWLLSQGRIPYVDFEWPFGVLPLYVPLWVSRLLHWTVVDAYYVIWTITSLIGVLLLFGTINTLNYPTPRKRAVFLLLFLAYLPMVLGMGAHYTLLRYMGPLWAALMVVRARTSTRTNGAGTAAGLALVFTAVLLLISPEMAVAHAFACCVLLFPKRSAISMYAVPVAMYTGMAVGMAGLFGVADRVHILDTLWASGGGADSFPIPLSAPVLMFFGTVVLCACAVVRRLNNKSLNDNSIAIVLIALPLTAAALGRCDPAHLLFNGAGWWLAGLLYASTSAHLWKLFSRAFVICIMVLPSYLTVRYGAGAIRKAVATAAAQEQLARLRLPYSAAREDSTPAKTRTTVPPHVDFASLYPGIDGTLQAPFGYIPNGYGTYHSTEVQLGFYEGLENANTSEAVERKITELREHPNRSVLVPGADNAQCSIDPEFRRQLITVLFAFPYLAKPEHPGSLHQRLCDYIVSHYVLRYPALPANFDYELWVPRRSG